MNDDEKYKIPLFDGTNYDNWRFRMETLLDEKDLLKYVEEPLKFESVDPGDDASVKAQKDARNAQDKKNDKRCKSVIIQKIADSHLEYAKGKATAHSVWKELQDTFERKGVASQLRLRKALLTMKLNLSEGMEAHFLKFDKMIRELKSTGATLEETDIVCHLLLTLRENFNGSE